ncbi:MAG: anti-sigma factor antagonist [Oscillatoriales cyanobacterium]|nr:MAG: anti-sigma factor antagonist [Oscillatoriales cyanobacterium]
MQTSTISPYALIRLEGHLDASNAGELSNRLKSVVESANADTIVVDMKKAESLDSAGLMALVSALRLAQTIGRQFILCSVSPAIRIIFELTQLDRVFDMRDDAATFVMA